MVKKKDCEGIINEIIERNKDRKAPVLAVLHEIQERFGYLPQDALECAAESLGISSAQIYSAATFYHLFSLKPLGRYVIRVCDNFVCYMKKNREIIETISNYLGISVGETTRDGMFTLLTTSCLGQCDHSPAMMINDEIYVDLTSEKVVEILKRYQEEK